MVLGARKVGAEARARYAEDTEKAQQLPELLEAARKAEEELLRARREGADVVELNRLGVAYDAALTEAMRAAYATSGYWWASAATRTASTGGVVWPAQR